MVQTILVETSKRVFTSDFQTKVWSQRDFFILEHQIQPVPRTCIQFLTTLKTKKWITLTSIKTRGEIRCPIANTMVKHSKKAKLNIIHITMNFWGFFFGPAKYFLVWQDLHICQSEWLTTSQQVSGCCQRMKPLIDFFKVFY